MKKYISVSVLSFLLCAGKIWSQTYAPIVATGYTLDAVAENTTAMVTTAAPLDGSNYIIYSAAYATLMSGSGGLPNNGVITNGTYSFQLQPYTQSNVLFMTNVQSDTLTFTTPSPYASLSLLGFATEGTGSMNVTVRFTDNTTQVFSNLSLADWFSGGSSIINGFGRASRVTGVINFVASQPSLYNTNLNLTCANRLKNVAKVIVQNTSANARIAIMAVSGAAMPSYTAASTQVGCVGGANGTATILATNALPPMTYTWSTSPVQTNSTSANLIAGIYSYTVVDAANCAFSSTVSVGTSTNPPLSVIALSTPTIVCSGNTATLSGGGATTYTWMPGNLTGANIIVSPLATTVYTVIGANAICSGVSTITLSTNPNPTVTTASSSFSVCAGTSVTLTAFGANSYTWQVGGNPVTGSVITVAPTSATAYQVSGSNSFGCTTGTSQVVIIQPSPVLSVIASNTAICFGGSSTLTASSNSNNYLWNFGSTNAVEVVNPSANTVYTISSTLGTCSASQTIAISVFTQTLAVSPSTAICMGKTLTLNASGGTTYQWSNGQAGSTLTVSPTSNTVYVVSATTQTNNMTCTSSGTVNVTVNPNPTVTAVSSKSVICKGETASITAGGATNYSWNTTETTAVINVTPTINTNFTVTGTDANGCTNTTTLQLKVIACTGIAQLNGSENYDVNIYPNPNNGQFTVKSDVAIRLNLINDLGQLIKTIDLTETNSKQIELTDLPTGIYFLIGRIGDANINQKIVVLK